jgi:U3 small nucleolar ribonucleoprotein protein IMP4
MDDEYANAGIHDPKLYITTARDPSTRLIQFAKELTLILPNSFRENRGSKHIDDIVATCRANEVTDLVIVHETRGEPGTRIRILF